MKAVVLVDHGKVDVCEVDAPELVDDGDALVRVTTAAICGSDLHVLDGRAPGVLPGMSIGHEFVGVVEEVGAAVSGVTAGERVVGAFLIPCGTCVHCVRGRFEVCRDQHTPGAGLFLGDLPGAQAELVRVSRADVALRRVPAGLSDEQALFAGDILSTALYANTLGEVGPGRAVVVQGCGPVGLLAVQVAGARGADPLIAVDVDRARLSVAEELGARPVDAGASNAGGAVERMLGDGADIVLDVVGGAPRNLLQALDIVRSGGRVVVAGLYTDLQAELPLAELFVNAVELRFSGMCPVTRIWGEALELVERGAVDPTAIISHRLPLDEAPLGYELFARREATKVVLEVAGRT